MTEAPNDLLDRSRISAGLSHEQLWLRYFELGGMSTSIELEAFVYGLLRPTAHDHDLIAHAINERWVELGGNHPIPYDADDAPRAPRGGDDRGEAIA